MPRECTSADIDPAELARWDSAYSDAYRDAYPDLAPAYGIGPKEARLRSMIDTDTTPHEPFRNDRFAVAWLVRLACLSILSASLIYGCLR